MNITQLVLALNLDAVVLSGMYYLPSYEFWYLKEFVFEFPQHSVTSFRMNIEVIKVGNRHEVWNTPQDKNIWLLDVLLMGGIVLTTIVVAILMSRVKQAVGNYIFVQFLQLGLAAMGNLQHFGWYEEKEFSTLDMAYIKERSASDNLARSFIIINFMIQGFYTIGSGLLSKNVTIIVWATTYMLAWMAP